jgi:RNA polymerase sigma-70 factor (ECF subfamily)
MKAEGRKHIMLESISSFEVFFKKYYHPACLIALRYVQTEYEAEDIVQETFIHLWEKKEQIHVRQSLKQYLYFAVKNRSINYLKREKQKFGQAENIFELIQSEDDNDNFAEEDLAVQISRSIELLPPQCKKIFLLAYIDNLTYNQIAESLDLSKNTIKTQMGIAYKILRQRLKSYFLMLLSIAMIRRK